MLDILFIKKNLSETIASLKKKKFDSEKIIIKLLKLDDLRITSQKKSNSIKKENVPIIDSEMVLEEVLQQITKTRHYFVLVRDSKNKIIGKITLKELLKGIQRPRQEIKKYA